MKQPIDHTKRINDQLRAKLEEIVAAMEAGTCAQDFEMPFSTIGSRPYNPATGH